MPTKKLAAVANKSATFWLFPIILLGTLLRFYNFTALSLWHDEAFSALYLRYPWAEMMHRISLDVHPPLYYILLRFWNYIFGSGLASLRGFSILFGLLAIFAGYKFVLAAFKNERLAILTALFLAVNPFQIEYSIEARMYALGTFLVLLSSYYLVKGLESNRARDWVIYGILAAAGLYTHYYMFFSIAAQGLYAIYYLAKTGRLSFSYRQDNLLLKSLGSYVFAAILYIPWLPTFLVQLRRVENNFWIPAPDRWSVPGTIWSMAFGGQGMDHITLSIATLTGLFVIIYFFRQTKPPIRWLIILGVIVPFAGALLLSFKQAIYLDRYFIFASLSFTVVIAAAVSSAAKYTTRRTLTILFCLVSLVIFFKNWRDLGSLREKPGMKAAASVINDNAMPSDRVYVGSSFVYFTFKYYNKTNIHPELISSGTLDTIPHFSGTALLSPDNLVLTDTIFNHPEVKKNDIVWLLWTTGFGSSKPNVPGSWQKINEKQFGDTPGYKGNIYVTEYHVN